MEDDGEVVTPGEVLGKASDLKPGTGAYVSPHDQTVYASLTGFRRMLSPPPDSPDQVHFTSSLFSPISFSFLGSRVSNLLGCLVAYKTKEKVNESKEKQKRKIVNLRLSKFCLIEEIFV